MSLYHAKPPEPDNNEAQRALVDKAVLYFHRGQIAQAFSLLFDMDEKAGPAAAFTLALCRLRAGEVSEAVADLERALRLSRALPQTRPAQAENTAAYRKLYQAQLEDGFYLSPPDADFYTLFPKDAERVILLALIHAYLKNGMREQARRLSSGLNGAIFEAYKKYLFDDNNDKPT